MSKDAQQVLGFPESPLIKTRGPRWSRHGQRGGCGSRVQVGAACRCLALRTLSVQLCAARTWRHISVKQISPASVWIQAAGTADDLI